MLTLLIVIAVVTSAPQAEPDSASEIRKIIERGIEAQGGERQLERLSKPWRATAKGKAGMLDITGEIPQQPPTQSTISTVIHVGPLSREVVVVTNGDKTWNRIAGFTNEVTGKGLEEMNDGEYRHHVQNLLPLLLEPGLQLSLLPETLVSGQPAAGIRVQSKGHRDIDLYFDKATGLVAKQKVEFCHRANQRSYGRKSYPTTATSTASNCPRRSPSSRITSKPAWKSTSTSSSSITSMNTNSRNHKVRDVPAN